MKEYIERGKLIGDILHALLVVPSEDFLLPPEKDILQMIKSEPAADVRPVVLCKNCKMQQYCKVAQYLGKDGFCSNGEKDVRSLGKCKLYKDCEYRTIWNCCCEDCNMMVK